MNDPRPALPCWLRGWLREEIRAWITAALLLGLALSIRFFLNGG